MKAQPKESGRSAAGPSTDGHSAAVPRPTLRSDAERNRQRLVEAARAVFAETGLSAPLEDIADRAGVGIATLYRRFPTREDLIAATYEAMLSSFAETIEAAVEAPDAWGAFTGCLERMCAMQAENRGFSRVMTMNLPLSAEVARLRDRAGDAIRILIKRAQEQGALREDFVVEDVVVLLMANSGVLNETWRAAPDAWKRQLAYMIDAYAVRSDRTRPLPTAPTPVEIRCAMWSYEAQAK
jgi:AcrR family transcriptional regulator